MLVCWSGVTPVLISNLSIILLFLFFDGVVLFFTPSTIFFTNFNKILKYIYNNQHIIIQRSVKFFINFVKIQRRYREMLESIESLLEAENQNADYLYIKECDFL